MLKTGFIGAVKWPLCPQMPINSYLNAIVVYLGFSGIRFYNNQNKIQILDFYAFSIGPIGVSKTSDPMWGGG